VTDSREFGQPRPRGGYPGVYRPDATVLTDNFMGNIRPPEFLAIVCDAHWSPEPICSREFSLTSRNAEG
jgi:hypothetical protein